MTYNQTLSFLFSQLPMFHRIGAAAYKADLNNTIALCSTLGNPENKFKSIHIAGTNGKGSTSAFIASVLQESGYKTGLFTSPHLKDFRERIKINGQMISKKTVTSFVDTFHHDFNEIKPSFFEWTFALAAWHFANEKVDIAVIETGMGGRLDSTNVISPLVSVITNIGLDHTQFLGNSLQEIASEKAGIIKIGTPVVIGETNNETAPVFKNSAQNHQSEITFADQVVRLLKTSYSKHRSPRLTCEYKSSITGIDYKLVSPLAGKYQLKNLSTVLCSLEILNTKQLNLTKENIEIGIRKTIINTALKGRWQTISNNPLTIADIGHNSDGIREVLEQIALTHHENLHFVIGVVNDKDVTSMLGKLPKDATYYFCKADIPRGLDAAELSKLGKSLSLKGNSYTSVKEALLTAKKAACKNDLIIVGGSAFVVAEVV